MKYTVLQEKLVVNERTGEILGHIRDLHLNLNTFTIESILVQERRSFFRRIKCLIFEDVKISVSVDNIVRIGKDIIVVRVR